MTEADLPAVLTPAFRNTAILAMIETGGFKDTPALARWAATPDADAILRRYLILRCAPLPTDTFAIDLAACERENAEEDSLAADIEARFG